MKGEPVPFTDDMGTSATTLCHYIVKLLPDRHQSDQKIVADLDYLQQKHFIIGNPTKSPGRTKVDKFKLQWFTITAYGKDIIEGAKKDPTMPKIEQHIVHISNVSNSPMSIGNSGSTITQTTNYSETDSVSKILIQIESELKELPTEFNKTAQELVAQLKGEISLAPEQQNNNIITHHVTRIIGWLTGLGPVASNIGKIVKLTKDIGNYFEEE